MTSFGPVAEHYDVLMSHVPYESWVDYYKLLLVQIDQQPNSFLDVCCGTGTVAELLAREGKWVTGFDLSEDMVTIAQSKVKRIGTNVEFLTADAATFQLGRTFEAAYSFFDSLNYITDPAKLRAAISQVAKHLEPGSSFIFDVNTAYAFEKQMFDQKEARASAPIRYDWRGDYDPATRLIEVHMKFERDGVEFTETHRQRAYTIDELTAFLDEAGFDTVRFFDSYTLNPPRKKSDRLHVVAVLP